MGWVSGQAYSDDLRARVLAAVDRGGRVTGPPGRKLDRHLDTLAAHVAAHPDATLVELVAWSRRERGVTACAATMWATLEALDLTRKKRHAMPPSRSAPTSPPRARSGERHKAA